MSRPGIALRQPTRFEPITAQAAKQRAWVDLEPLGNDIGRMQRQQLLGFDALGLSHRAASADVLPARFSGEHAGPRSFANQRALELRERGHDMKQQRPTRRSRVDALGERSKLNASYAELVDQFDELRQRAPQAVQTPHDQRIALGQRSHRLAEAGARESCTRDPLIGEDVIAARRFQRCKLQVEILIIGRNSRVSNSHSFWSCAARPDPASEPELGIASLRLCDVRLDTTTTQHWTSSMELDEQSVCQMAGRGL